MAFCSNCGSMIPKGVRVCVECGTPVGGSHSVEGSDNTAEDNALHVQIDADAPIAPDTAEEYFIIKHSAPDEKAFEGSGTDADFTEDSGTDKDASEESGADAYIPDESDNDADTTVVLKIDTDASEEAAQTATVQTEAAVVPDPAYFSDAVMIPQETDIPQKEAKPPKSVKHFDVDRFTDPQRSIAPIIFGTIGAVIILACIAAAGYFLLPTLFGSSSYPSGDALTRMLDKAEYNEQNWDGETTDLSPEM